MHAATSVAVVFDGFVLGPDGGPAAEAVVVSSAGGKAVTELDGHYRLAVAVPLEAESVQLTALASDSGALASAGRAGRPRVPSKVRRRLRLPSRARSRNPLASALRR